MELKKNPSKDLEPKKNMYFQLGLVFALAVVLVAFEWKKYDKAVETTMPLNTFIAPDEEVEITRPEKQLEPPPPQAPQITIVDDDVEVDDDITIDAEADQTTASQEYYAPTQTEVEQEVVEAEIFTIVEEQPSFDGGEAKLMEFLQKNISYPPIAKESNISGTVFVTFVVEPDGGVSNVKILRGIGGGCDEEAMRVVKAMPKWKPGKQRNKPVRVQFNLPIRFILQG